LASDPHFRRLFVNEARIAALLHHPNIVQLIDSGEIDSVLYLAMELVEGVSLERLLASAPVAPAVAADVMQELLDGLQYAHALTNQEGRPLRLVHRDVSATNVLVSRSGDVKLTDFGVARVTGSTMTLTNEVKGKRAYMAPEQVAGRVVDGRADLFAAG